MVVSIATLSDELLLMILHEVEQISVPKFRSMSRLCLVSQRFCSLAIPAIYHTVILPQSESTDIECMVEATGYSYWRNVMDYTRHIIVHDKLNWPSLVQLLPGMYRLDSLRWKYWVQPFPRGLRTVLQEHWPEASLHIEQLAIGFRTDEATVQRKDLALLKSLLDLPNLRSCNVQINYEHPVTMRWLKDVLLSSKSLERLSMTLPRLETGRIDFSDDGLGSYDLCVEPGERLESLNKLVYESRIPFTKPLIPTSFFNWDKICHLELRGHRMISFLRTLSPHNLQLHTLIVEFFCMGESYDTGLEVLDDIITRTRGLKVLTLVNPTLQLPVSTISLHGNTLEELTIRHPRRGSEPYSMMVAPYPYLPDSLDTLCSDCPHIWSLTLDIRTNTWLCYDVLAALARFPNLSLLRLYFHFEYVYVNAPYVEKHPHISTDRLTALHIFSFLHGNKVGASFDCVEMMLGDSPRNPRHQLRNDMLIRPNVWFVCREDEAGKLAVEDDVGEDENPQWQEYFGPERLKRFPGETFPHNLLELIEAGEEADKVFIGGGGCGDVDDIDDLF